MTMRFSCERCGHAFELDESLAGSRGRCKSCGHEMTAPSPGFRLAPLPEAVTAGPDAAEQSPLVGRSSASGKAPKKGVKLVPVEEPSQEPSDFEKELDYGTPYEIDQDFEPPRSAAPSSPAPLLMEARAGWRHAIRSLQKRLSRFEDAIYLALMLFWLVGAVAFLFEAKPLAWAALGLLVICSLLLMLLGGFEVFVKPFQESLRHGLAFVLIPPYAIYYVVTRWKQMKRPFRNAISAFLPLIVLLVLALLGRPIRDWFLHPPPKQEDQQASKFGDPSVPTLPRIPSQASVGGSAPT